MRDGGCELDEQLILVGEGDLRRRYDGELLQRQRVLGVGDRPQEVWRRVRGIKVWRDRSRRGRKGVRLGVEAESARTVKSRERERTGEGGRYNVERFGVERSIC